ncbi:MAG: tetratricopeptide repeat protein [Balneolaceae bacterium]
MKILTRVLTFAFTLVLATGATDYLQAQQSARVDAINAYNNARDLVDSGEYLDAIELYMEAMEIAESPACEDCADLVEQSQNQIPRVYYQRALSQYEQFRSSQTLENIQLSIDYFEEAGDAGEEYGDADVRDGSQRVLPQLYYTRSRIEYNNEDYDSALESLDIAIDLNANYTLAYYQRGIVLNNSGAPLEDVLAAFDQAIEVGTRLEDNENVARAQRRAAEELVYQGYQQSQNNQRTEAIELLEQALEYDSNNVDAYFRLAEVQNQRGSYQAAQGNAERALELETGGVTDRAPIYYELGLSLQGQGSATRAQACQAFENAAYGEFRDPALHIMEYELECQDL